MWWVLLAAAAALLAIVVLRAPTRRWTPACPACGTPLEGTPAPYSGRAGGPPGGASVPFFTCPSCHRSYGSRRSGRPPELVPLDRPDPLEQGPAAEC